ncbi:hypothetical protein [Parasulfitobacter algicola]|uniref:Uncharacterized protein n=1 Tax=Parasulfitobacter algicola TaxID=2614809 RepID=A0ABX2IQU1_9RHOB|nr:hypothetical protein [Sulfitobacter algicola]NSX55249.1 hypothetical protein [Sulfitobacter algicola]
MFVHVVIVFGIIHGFLMDPVQAAVPGHYFDIYSMFFESFFCAVYYAVLLGASVYVLRKTKWVFLFVTLLHVGLSFVEASLIVESYQIYFGNTWRGTEAFTELFFHPIWTPLLLILGWATQLWIIQKLLHLPQASDVSR